MHQNQSRSAAGTLKTHRQAIDFYRVRLNFRQFSPAPELFSRRGQLFSVSNNSIHIDIASVASVNRGVNAPLFFHQQGASDGDKTETAQQLTESHIFLPKTVTPSLSPFYNSRKRLPPWDLLRLFRETCWQ
jgi:hypothetical protein